MKKIRCYKTHDGKIYESRKDAVNALYEQQMKLIDKIAHEIAKIDKFRHMDIAEYLYDNLEDFRPILDINDDEKIHFIEDNF